MPRWQEEDDAAVAYDMSLKETKRGVVQTLKKTKPTKNNPSQSVASESSQSGLRRNMAGISVEDAPEALQVDHAIPDEFFNVYTLTNEGTGSRSSNSSHEYMRQWIPVRRDILNEILRREAPPVHINLCSKCGTKEFRIRCKDCLYNPLLCVQCCKETHQHLVFHRIETWSGTHFTPAWLWQTGVSIHLGHAGNHCPSNEVPTSDIHSLITPLSTTFNYTHGQPQMDDDDSETEEDSPEYGWSGSGKPPHDYAPGASKVVIVHTNAVHHLPVYLCTCPGAREPQSQYLEMGLYPSTFKHIETLFTFHVLDDYLLQSLECQTSCHHYYSKLRRMTNSVFPKSVPDRKRELARAERQWRNLKEWKWFGFGHTTDIPGDATLALFCPTCPQPGINLPEDWKNDDAQWKFYRQIAADGNFVAVHQQQLRTTKDVWIKDGEGFMTRRTPYYEYLRCTQEVSEPCTCNEHRAVLDRAKPHKGCDCSGIGAFACLRHGCYCPGSIVNFQKGERQKNMDYGYVKALKHTHTDETDTVIHCYDINCQYHKNLRKRVGPSQYLSFRVGLRLIPAIGLFHVHGHQDSCYARYAPRFIPGAAMADGEVMERLFSTLNGISTHARTMTLAHRSETLDSHMGDNNFKKMIDMVPTLCKKWIKVCSSARDAETDFKMMSETASKEQTQSWTEAVVHAETERADHGDVEAMDVYTVKFQKVIPQAEIRANLMQAEQNNDSGVGITSWLVEGMKIQEIQSDLVMFIRRQGKKPSAEQRVQINRKREALRKRVDQFNDSFTQLFPALHSQSDEMPLMEIPYGEEIIDEDDDEATLASVPIGEIEKTPIVLPSTCPFQRRTSLKAAAEGEMALRIAQAENALEGVRTELGHKSFLYRNNIALSTSKTMKTRGYDAVKSADQELRRHVRVYKQARNALVALRCPAETLKTFQDLLTAQLVPLKSIYEPNSRGQGNYALPWFWAMRVEGDSDSSEYMEELHRVNWMRARAKFLRWEEESILVPSEMLWTQLFFENRSRGWDVRAGLSTEPGQKAYARKQEALWKELAKQAKTAFGSCLIRHIVPGDDI